MVKRKTVIVDFDGVLNSYASGWQGAAVINDPPVEGAMEWLAQVVEHYNVAIVSTRSHQPGGRGAMKDWLAFHAGSAMQGGVVSALIDGRLSFPDVKPPAVMTLDDRARRFDGPGTFPSVEEIEAFEPWFKRRIPEAGAFDPLSQAGWDAFGLAYQNRRLRWHLFLAWTTAIGILFTAILAAVSR